MASVLLGAIASDPGRSEPADELIASAETAAIMNERRKAEYRRYIDDLRTAVLSLPGTEQIADRIVRDELRPLGILHGRTVASGPTADEAHCMIVENLPTASITCLSVDDAYAQPVSVELPAWYSDAESDLFTGLGELISYTLLPGGDVVAVPAHSLDRAGPQGAARSE